MTGRATTTSVAKYRTIVADPPWPLKWDGGGMRSGPTSWGRPASGRTTLGYETMTLAEIEALPVSELAEDDAHLYLWSPDRFLVDGDAARIARSWGFNPGRVLLFWAKPGIGLGKFPRPQHEALLVCRRGKLPFHRFDVGSVQQWPQSYGPAGKSIAKIGSSKPEASLDLIETVSPGPYLELFARRARFGWDYWGNESLGTVEMPA